MSRILRSTDIRGALRARQRGFLLNPFRFIVGGGGAPTLSSAAIPSAGTTINLVFSASVSIGAGGNGGVTLSMSGGAVTATYASGSGSNTLVYNLSRTVTSAETGTVSYTQPGDGIEATTGGADVATFSGSTVTNSSTQGSQLFSDAFTSGVNQALTTYSGSWTLMQGGYVVNTDGICYGSVNQTNLARWNANTFNAAHYIEGVVGNITGSNYPGLAVACQSGASSAYYFIIASGGYNEFGRTNAGADSPLDTTPTTVWAATDIIRMEVSQPNGTTTRVVVKRAVAATPTSFTTVLTYDDTSGSRLTGGGAGLGSYGNNAGLAGLTSVAGGNL